MPGALTACSWATGAAATEAAAAAAAAAQAAPLGVQYVAGAGAVAACMTLRRGSCLWKMVMLEGGWTKEFAM